MSSRYGYPPCAEFEIGQEVWCWSVPTDEAIVKDAGYCQIMKHVVSGVRIILVQDGESYRWIVFYDMRGGKAWMDVAGSWHEARIAADDAYRAAVRRIARSIEEQEPTFIGEPEPVAEVPAERPATLTAEEWKGRQVALLKADPVETTPTEGDF